MHSHSFLEEIYLSSLIDQKRSGTSYQFSFHLSSPTLTSLEALTSFFFYFQLLLGSYPQLARFKRSLAAFQIKEKAPCGGYLSLPQHYSYFDYCYLYHLPEHQLPHASQFFSSHSFYPLSFFTTFI